MATRPRRPTAVALDGSIRHERADARFGSCCRASTCCPSSFDECGRRVGELETAQVGDLDEHGRAIRVRWTVEKNERYRHLDLPDDLFAAIVATLPPREDREHETPLFLEWTRPALRTANTRACNATGTPHFSPHGLRRRRGSLHYKRTGSLADPGLTRRAARVLHGNGPADGRLWRAGRVSPDRAATIPPCLVTRSKWVKRCCPATGQ